MNFDQILHTYTFFFEIGRENDKEKKKKNKKKIVMPGFEPLCVRLFNYMQACSTTRPPRIVYIYTRAISHRTTNCFGDRLPFGRQMSINLEGKG